MKKAINLISTFDRVTGCLKRKSNLTCNMNKFSYPVTLYQCTVSLSLSDFPQ